MFQPGPNDALSQNFMKLGLLVAEKKRGQTDTHTDRQDSCFISIDLCVHLYRYHVSIYDGTLNVYQDIYKKWAGAHQYLSKF